ncbi:MAG: hypothetical protein ING19_20735 [Azospirillum sp.]|nr:hypothetical protein [Azospirillum sp.]MCA3268478.1 hypothetical protein [Azospirillum sp.]
MARKLTAAGPKDQAAAPATGKKGRKAKAVEAPQIYTEQQKREALEFLEAKHADLEAAKATLTRANGSYRKQLKEAAKVLGKETADLVWLMSAKKREPEDIDRETRRRNELARFAGLKLGTQLGLFEADGGEKRSIGDQVERDVHAARGGAGKAGDAESIARAKQQGTADGGSGKGYQNFYEDGSPEFLAYKGSFEAAVAQIAGGMKPDDDMPEIPPMLRRGARPVAKAEAH